MTCSRLSTARYTPHFTAWSAKDGLQPNGKPQARTSSANSNITGSPQPAGNSSSKKSRNGKNSRARLRALCGLLRRADMRRRHHRNRGRDHDLEREISSHLDLEAEQQQENGLSPEDARYAARRAFGNVTSIKEEVHMIQGWMLWETIFQELRYACRTLRKTPG